ncbi:MAG: ATP-binding protein [Desulfurellales bacterium]|nr:MAG: ATP-binding protein [Desulfurellales bacterium]
MSTPPSKLKPSDNLSKANWLALQSQEFQDQFLEGLSDDELRELVYCWDFWARPSQTRPPGDWRYWYLQAGRGFGKTRTIVETVLEYIREGFEFVNLAARTSGDLRRILIDGESSISRCSPPDLRPKFIFNKNELRWPDGRRSICMSADEPDQARGTQSEVVVCDEVATWPDVEFIDNLDKGLRLGQIPRMICASTGKRRNAVIQWLLKKKSIVVTRGSTLDNAGNLPASYIEEMLDSFDGSVRGRQELYGDTGDDVSGAWFNQDNIDANRVVNAPPLKKLSVGCDPAITSNRRSDRKGIVIGGLGHDGHVYVLEDLSIKAPPQVWIPRLIDGCRRWNCRRAVVETNRGGELIEHSISRYAEEVGFQIEIVCINSQEDKTTRAEPVSILYEKNKVHHVGTHRELEAEITTWEEEQGKSPDPLDALCFMVNDLLPLCTASFESFRVDQPKGDTSPLGRPTQGLLAKASHVLERRGGGGVWR